MRKNYVVLTSKYQYEFIKKTKQNDNTPWFCQWKDQSSMVSSSNKHIYTQILGFKFHTSLKKQLHGSWKKWFILGLEQKKYKGNLDMSCLN